MLNIMNYDNGSYALIDKKIAVYKKQDKILKKYILSKPDEHADIFYISVFNENTQVDTIGPFPSQKAGTKALKKLANNSRFSIPYSSTIAAGIIIFLLGGYILPHNSGGYPVMNQNPMANMEAIKAMNDDPDIAPNILKNKPVVTPKAQQLSNIPKIPAKDMIVLDKLKAIQDATHNRQPITSSMLDGLPPELANKIRNVAQDVGLYQADKDFENKQVSKAGGLVLGSHKVSENSTQQAPSNDLDLVKIPVTQKPSTESDNNKITDLEKKKNILSGINGTNAVPGSDYSSLDNLSKDYPDLSNKK